MDKILVVDDDESILDAISLLLEVENYTVRTTIKGDETYKNVDEFRPHLIILDVLMSGVDGRQICKKLKSGIHTRKIPIIMISAHPGAKYGAMASGAEEFLAKPFEIDDLLSKVKFLINSPYLA
jgi:DNA-binding response OmpR family regulator